MKYNVTLIFSFLLSFSFVLVAAISVAATTTIFVSKYQTPRVSAEIARSYKACNVFSRVTCALRCAMILTAKVRKLFRQRQNNGKKNCYFSLLCKSLESNRNPCGIPLNSF